MGPNGPGFGIFEETFRCYSMVFFENSKAEEEFGGKSECWIRECDSSSFLSHSSYSSIVSSRKIR